MILDSFRRKKNLIEIKHYDIKYNYIDKHIPFARLDSHISRYENNDDKLKNKIKIIYKKEK
jgi:hypothetical protein